MPLFIFVLVIDAVSILLMLALLFEFHHIHRKRVALLEALGSANIRAELRERRILTVIYMAFTLCIVLLPFFFYS